MQNKKEKSTKNKVSEFMSETSGLLIFLAIVALIAAIVFGLPMISPKIGTYPPWKFIPGAKRAPEFSAMSAFGY